MLLTHRDDRYDFRHPQPQDVLLLVEVADSSLDFDRSVKLPSYAAAGLDHSSAIPTRFLSTGGRHVEPGCPPAGSSPPA